MISNEANQMYRVYEERYYRLLSRGADHPTEGFPHQLDNIRLELNSLALAMQTWRGDPKRLDDIVVATLRRIKPSLQKIESKFGPGTRVEPGSTVHVPFRPPETAGLKYSVDELADKAPAGIAEEKGAELVGEAPWYFWNGMDLRIVTVFGIAGILYIGWRARSI